MSVRTNAAILAVAIAFGAGGFAASRRLFPPDASTRPAAPAVVGRPYVDVPLRDLDGRIRRLSEFAGHGRPLIVNFWATWCAPCVREMPLLDAFAKRHPGVAVVGIALDSADAVRPFVSTLAVSYPILVDAPSGSDSSVRHGNARGVLPYSVLIGADGTVEQAEAGDFDDLAALARFAGVSNAR